MDKLQKRNLLRVKFDKTFDETDLVFILLDANEREIISSPHRSKKDLIEYIIENDIFKFVNNSPERKLLRKLIDKNFDECDLVSILSRADENEILWRRNFHPRDRKKILIEYIIDNEINTHIDELKLYSTGHVYFFNNRRFIYITEKHGYMYTAKETLMNQERPYFINRSINTPKNITISQYLMFIGGATDILSEPLNIKNECGEYVFTKNDIPELINLVENLKK